MAHLFFLQKESFRKKVLKKLYNESYEPSSLEVDRFRHVCHTWHASPFSMTGRNLKICCCWHTSNKRLALQTPNLGNDIYFK